MNPWVRQWIYPGNIIPGCKMCYRTKCIRRLCCLLLWSDAALFHFIGYGGIYFSCTEQKGWMRLSKPILTTHLLSVRLRVKDKKGVWYCRKQTLSPFLRLAPSFSLPVKIFGVPEPSNKSQHLLQEHFPQDNSLLIHPNIDLFFCRGHRCHVHTLKALHSSDACRWRRNSCLISKSTTVDFLPCWEDLTQHNQAKSYFVSPRQKGQNGCFFSVPLGKYRLNQWRL